MSDTADDPRNLWHQQRVRQYNAELERAEQCRSLARAAGADDNHRAAMNRWADRYVANAAEIDRYMRDDRLLGPDWGRIWYVEGRVTMLPQPRTRPLPPPRPDLVRHPPGWRPDTGRQRRPVHYPVSRRPPSNPVWDESIGDYRGRRPPGRPATNLFQYWLAKLPPSIADPIEGEILPVFTDPLKPMWEGPRDLAIGATRAFTTPFKEIFKAIRELFFSSGKS